MLAVMKPCGDSGSQCGARPRMPSKRLDQKGVLFKKLANSRTERSDYRFTVGAIGETKSMRCCRAKKTFSF